MLTRIFYISEIVETVSEVDVQVILGVAQVNNRRLDVTGMLVRSDGHFAQVLEGRSDVIRALMGRIAADPRHRAVRRVFEDSIERRQFARWSMGLVRRDDMAEVMATLHREGSKNNSQARWVMQQLVASVD